MCRCAERRAALLRSLSALVGGDAAQVAPALRFVARTGAADAADLARRAAARLRLAR